MEEWEEDKPSMSSITFEDEFDAERDLVEIERLLEEAEYNELNRSGRSLTCRVASSDSTSPSEKK